MNMNKMSDVKVHSSLGNTGPIAIACIYDSARYHIWVDRVTHAPLDTKLYKNPPLDVEHLGVGYFHTQVLDSGSNFGKTLIAAMFSEAAVNGAFSKAAADQISAENLEDAVNAERMRIARIARIEKAALALYTASLAAFEFISKVGYESSARTITLDVLKVAIAKAEAQS